MARVQGTITIPVDLAVVEDGLPGQVVLPSGSTWNDFMMAVSAADDYDTIWLPNETIVQTSGLSLKKPVNIIGQGPLSNIKHTGNIIMSGSGRCIEIDTHDIVFANFGMEGDQTQSVGNRTQGIVVQGGVNLAFRGLRFKTISANPINLHSPGNQPLKAIDRISIEECIFDEFWEQGIEIGTGAQNIVIVRNKLKSSSRNLQLSGVTPFGIAVTLENPTADQLNIARNIDVIGNEVDFTALQIADSHGVQVSEGSRTKPWQYEKIRVAGNKFMGCGAGVRCQGFHSDGLVTNGAVLTIADNHFDKCLVNPVVIQPPLAKLTTDAKDTIAMLHNEFIGIGAGQVFYKQFNAATHPVTIVDVGNKKLA